MNFSFFKKITENKGQTLLEALIALSVLVIILGATAVAVLTSLNNTAFIKQQNQANKLAQQGMEYIRDRINNSGANAFQTYSNLNQTQCFNDITNPNPLVTGACSSANIQNTFKREVSFTKDLCDTGNSFINGLTVTVSVYWNSGKCTSPFCHKQKVTSCFIDPSHSLPAGVSNGI